MPVDAVVLPLHGAMVAEHYDDGEGELLNRIRRIAPDVPIAVALDFHTQMTDAMIKGASIITGHRTYPHIDMADTARRAGRTLLRMLAGEVEPKMVWGNRPIMSSSLVHTPSREPMKTLMGMANQAEDTGQVLNASVFGGFPQADIPHLALSSVIVCDKRTAEGEILLNKILDTAWEKREGFLFHPEPLSVQVARAKSLEGGPVVMADHGDNTASGGTQDVMSVIEEAMKLSTEPLVCNQFECHPFLDQSKVIAATKKRGMAVVAYSPIARGQAKGDALLGKIGKAHGKTATQVCLRYLVQQQIIVIPRTSKSERLKENVSIFDFELSAAEMKEIHSLAHPGGRIVDWSGTPQWD